MLVVWQEGTQAFVGVSRDGGLLPVAVEVSGTDVVPVGVAQGEAGVLVFIERASNATEREIVVVQVCDLG